ncbi:MAG: glycosyltransferase family 2 protein [bacterium]
MKIAIIIPAFNEEKNIGQVVEEVKKIVPWVIVVDDGSVDGTAQLAKEKNAEVLKHLVNSGQGAALKTGTEWAVSRGAEIIVHFDADGQHLADDIKVLVEPIIKNEADVVLGSRFLKKDVKTPLTKKYLILWPAIIFNWFLTGVKLTDAHNGLRALNREAWQKISLTQPRMAHNTEILSEIRRNKLYFKEVGVTVLYQDYGQGLKGGLRIIKDLIKGKIFF